MNRFLPLLTAINFLFGSAVFAGIQTSKVAEGSEPAVVSDENGNVDVVFLGTKANGIHVVLFTALDASQNWSAPTNVFGTSLDCLHPDIAIEHGGAIVLTWTSKTGNDSKDVFFVRSNDGGKTWTEAKNISKTGTATDSVIAVTPDQSIHVVWQNKTQQADPCDILYTRSTDNGATWSTPENVSNTPKHASEPAIAVDDEGDVGVCWLDSRSGDHRPDIFYSRKSNGAWTHPLNVSDSPRMSGYPGIAFGTKNMVFISWADNSRKEKSPDIWCAVGNRKEHFRKPINISDTPGVSSHPAIAADNHGHVVVVWADTSPGVSDIFGRISTDRADDFSTVLDLPHTVGTSTNPRVTISGDHAYVVWEEDEGKGSVIEFTQLSLKGVAEGPVRLVDPVIHPSGVSRNH